MTVFFQGYEVFSRSNPVWGYLLSWWGYAIAPWVATGVLCLSFNVWLVNGYVTRGARGFQVPSLKRVNVKGGIAPQVQAAPKRGLTKFQRWFRWVPPRFRKFVVGYGISSKRNLEVYLVQYK